MAEEEKQEEVINLDEANAESSQDSKSDYGALSPIIHAIKDNKLVMIGVIAIGVLILLFFILVIVFLLNRPKAKANAESTQISRKIIEPSPILSGTKRPEIDGSELDNMIKKANILYEQGDKLEALHLFENIASYSQSIAHYNLGVIDIKDGNYKAAISAFDGAVNAGEDISVSAFNAAYSAYMLGDMNLYEYYLGVSSSYLFHAANQPLYSYLYGLLQYYRGFYFESLSPFLNPNAQNYAKQSKKMAAEAFLVFGDEYNALAQLKQVASKDDNLPIGLLHARLGEYTQAKQYLYEYLGHRVGDPRALMALQLIELKNSNFKESALILERLNSREEDKFIFEEYPIKAKLREDLFDVNLAQEHFWHRRFEHNKMLGYKLLFYYAPFLVFDAKGAIDIIGDGNLNAYVNNIESAKSTLLEGQQISQVNRQVAQELRDLMLSQDIRVAIKAMEELLKAYPNHAILHYDVGLLYAQMNDFDNAYAHFIRTYHLDGNNTMAGIFAIMCAELTYRDTMRLSNAISKDLSEINFSDKIEYDFLLSLFRYTSDTPMDALVWFNDMQKQDLHKRKPIYYALSAVYGIYNANKEQIVSAFEGAKKIYVKDVVTNTMLELGKRFGSDLREFALQMNVMYKEKNVDMRSIYYGPSLARELYVYVGFVTGSLRSIQEELEAKLVANERTNNGILQALALSNIYSNDFEKAFALYNSIIDDLKEDDSQTRFFAAVSAMGANRHENAVALLQLSKIESANNFEARYALGLLYQEAKNMKAAIQHYDRISNVNFESEYFDFDIDTSDLLDTTRNASR